MPSTIERLEQAKAELELEIARLEAYFKENQISASLIVKQHHAMLHEYNDVRDVGLGLAGILADHDKEPVAVTLERFGLSTKD